MINFLFYATMIAFIAVCLFMILLVLVQKGRGGGLAAAFGGMGGNTAFGSKTGDVLTWTTAVVFGIFVLLAVALNLLAQRRQAGPLATVPTAATALPAALPAPDATPLPTTLPAATTTEAAAGTPTTTPMPVGASNVLNAPPTTAPAATLPAQQ
jgi:preprotein translocase subunit SecG